MFFFFRPSLVLNIIQSSALLTLRFVEASWLGAMDHPPSGASTGPAGGGIPVVQVPRDTVEEVSRASGLGR